MSVLLIKNGVLPGTMATFKSKRPNGTTRACELRRVPWFPNLNVMSHGHRVKRFRNDGSRPSIKAETESAPTTVFDAPKSSTPYVPCVAKHVGAMVEGAFSVV